MGVKTYRGVRADGSFYERVKSWFGYKAHLCGRAKTVRIGLEEDRRVFTPLARSSYAWRTAYRKRPSVERVNSRLDVSFGFERHYIGGLAKMKLRVGLALLVTLGMAQGRVKQKRGELMRSPARTA